MAITESCRTMGWFQNLTTRALYGQSDEQLRARYEIEARRMFECRTVKEMPEVDLVETVAEVAINDAGRLGLIVGMGYRARAVHEINREGSFSKRLPYWTRKGWHSCQPQRFARCLFLRNKHLGNPMKRYSEQIRHVGHAIVEMDTDFRPFQTYDAWKLSLDQNT